MRTPAIARRTFLGAAALFGTAAAALIEKDLAAAAPAADGGPIRAVAFDAFTVFDRRPVDEAVEGVFPGRGAMLSSAWSTKQFEYTWLRTLTGTYADFGQVTAESFDFCVQQAGLTTTADQRDQLLGAWRKLAAWPDAAPALNELRDRGIRLAFLSNAPAAMLDQWVANAGLHGLFEPHLSTDRVRAFKPDPRSYQMGVRAFGLPPAQIAFSAHAGWDACGAQTFGYPTFWVNRIRATTERLAVAPAATGANLGDIASFVGQQ